MSISITQFFNQHKLLIVGVLTIIMLVASQAVLRAEDRRIVTLYVDGQEMIVPTTAPTVGELLERANINVHEYDLVEPALDSEIGTDSYNINVYRARPITVVDGAEKFKVMSPYQSPQRIAESAGLTVYDEDEYELERIDNILLEGAIGLKLSIDRSTPFTMNLYGEAYETRTQAETVGELISEKGIELAEGDTIRPSADTKLTADTEVFVLATGTDVITEEVEIDFAVEEINDSAKEIGFEEIKEAGQKGRKTITYELTLENSKEVGRKKLSEVILSEPKKQVVVVGTKAVAPAATNITGSKQDWLAASGIPAEQWVYVDYIVQKESGWNPNAVNPSSGACGLGQQLPCGKWPGAWNDPVAALQAQYGYVNARYGGYAGAYNFWFANSWY